MTVLRTLSLGEIARLVGGRLEGPDDRTIRRAAGIEDAGPDEITFVANRRYRGALAQTRAGAVLLPPDLACPRGVACIRVSDPYAALVRVLLAFDPGPPELDGIHATAVVGEGATLASGVALGPHVTVGRGARLGARTRVAAGCVIGEAASLGEDCYLHPRVVVAHRCVIGNRVVVHAGAVIGADGFGYAPVDGVFCKVPQLGIVNVEDDVEIGANACIDRATFGETRIGRGAKIDNLVQVAHNVAIGEGSALAAQSGIAGSTRIGKGVRLGGQAGLAGHLRVGDGASIAAQAGVIGNVDSGETVSGYPARPHRDMMRVEAIVQRLPEFLKRLKALEQKLAEAPRENDA